VAELGSRPTFPDAWITIANFALIPVALWLGWLLAAQSTPLSLATAAAGVAAALVWAAAYERPDLEAIWLGLGAAWWLGLAILLVMRGLRGFAIFTFILAVATAVDTVAVLMGETGLLWSLAGAKLALSFAWAFAVGVRLLVDPMLGHDTDERSSETR
jgi:hypothetical protein